MRPSSGIMVGSCITHHDDKYSKPDPPLFSRLSFATTTFLAAITTQNIPTRFCLSFVSRIRHCCCFSRVYKHPSHIYRIYLQIIYVTFRRVLNVPRVARNGGVRHGSNNSTRHNQAESAQRKRRGGSKQPHRSHAR